MIALLLLMMGYHQTGTVIHEWLGVMLLLMFLLHNLINRKWYMSILKGKYSFQRTFQFIINIALLIVFLLTLISGMMMSKTVFGFLNLQSTMFARKLHMFSTSWSFLLMSVHLGLHWSVISRKITQKFNQSICKIIVLVCIFIGCYVFIEKAFYNELFLLVDFIFLDYQESMFIFLIKQLMMMTPFLFLGYQLPKKLKNK